MVREHLAKARIGQQARSATSTGLALRSTTNAGAPGVCGEVRSSIGGLSDVACIPVIDAPRYVNMAVLNVQREKSVASPTFLAEADIRRGVESLYFGV